MATAVGASFDERDRLPGYPYQISMLQMDKEGRALRTETTINNTRDVDIKRMLPNLVLLRRIGFSANRHLLDVQTVTHDCMTGHEPICLHCRASPRLT